MDSDQSGKYDSDILLSIIIPTWNRSECLKRCIDNILALGEEAIEVVLVDDASNDDTCDVCLHYARIYKNVIAKKLNKNVGPGAARNIGMKIAQGKWYYFLDSDDQINKKEFKQLLEKLRHTSQCQIIRVNAVDITENCDDFNIFTFRKEEGWIDAETYLAGQPLTQVWLYVFRAGLLHDYEIRFPGTHIAEDVAFVYMSVYAARQVCYLPFTVVSHYHQASNMLTKTIAYKEADNPMHVCLKSISDFLNIHFDAEIYERYRSHFEKTSFGKLSSLLHCHVNNQSESSLKKMLLNVGEIAKAQNCKVYLSPVSSEAIMVSKVYREITDTMIDGFVDNNTSRLAEPFVVRTADTLADEKTIIVLVTLNIGTRNALHKQLLSLGYVCKFDSEIIRAYSSVNTEDVA